jgi:hypothetical protein
MVKALTSENKIKIFFDRLAASGVFSSIHKQAFNALHSGAYVRDLQVVLGHNHLETTILYLHTEAGRVASPSTI